MICAIHNKEMRFNAKFGWSCPTPLEKSPDGKVLKWCDWKPDTATPENPNYTPHMAEKSAEIREKLIPDEKPDWDEIAKGKVRHGVAVAFISLYGRETALTDQIKTDMNDWVEWIMSGK